MERHPILIIVAVLLSAQLFSQPSSGGAFRLHKNMVYYGEGNQSLLLDLYIPGGHNLASGIGVAGKETRAETDDVAKSSALPVLIWLPEPGKDKFPNPVASYVGNGYAVVSLQFESESAKLKNIAHAIIFLRENVSKFNLDTKNIGIIQPAGNGYLALIWQDGMEQLTTISIAPVSLTVVADADLDFLKLQTAENTHLLIGFFDQHLRNGVHKESDPISLNCPVDSWVDPITNPIPGTTYHLFPTPVRGKETQGSYLIYLPKEYAVSNKRYPVIYWLHGGNGNSRQGCWMCEKMSEAMQNGNMPQSIVVFVQGLPVGWYNNSKDGTMPVENVIIKDLIPHIDAAYRTINKREARAIEGMSMGGYGSLHLGFKYPELFGVVSSIAPSITTFEMERKEVIAATFENDTAYFNANSPATLVKKNADYIRRNTTIRLLVGDKDFLFDFLNKFHQQLIDLKIDHQYAIAKDADHDYREVISKLDSNPFNFWKNSFLQIGKRSE